MQWYSNPAAHDQL